jgi:branched-chain amino acid transport system substrate-binding protein
MHKQPWAAGALLAFSGLAAGQAGQSAQQAPSAQLKKPIVIGQTLVQSGPLADLSAGPATGVRALVQAVNAAGGVNGRPLELRQADDGYDAAKAADNVRAFVRQGAVAILMPIGTTSSAGALQAANEARVPLVGPYSGAEPLRRFTPWGFSVRIGFDEEYERIVQHLVTIGVQRIAFAGNDNPGARAALETTRRSIERRGSALAASVLGANDGADAAAQAQALARSAPPSVVLSMSTAVAAKFIAAYRASGASAAATRFYSFSFLDGQRLHKSLGADAAGVVISQVVPSPWNATMPLVAAYQAAMRRIGVQEFGYASFEGYLNARVLAEALRRAGPDPTPQSTKAALEGFQPLDLGGVAVRFDAAQHAGLGFSELTMLRADGGFAR